MADPRNENLRQREIDLVKRCLGDDPEARREFLQTYTPRMTRAIEETLRGFPASVFRAVSVDDVLQNCFVELWRDGKAVLRRFDGSSSLATYLAVIASRQALQLVRAQKRFVRSTEPTPDTAEMEQETQGDPLDALLRREGGESVKTALAQLSPREQTVLRWIRVDGLTSVEVGRLLNLSDSSVRSLLSRAEEKLRDLLRPPAE